MKKTSRRQALYNKMILDGLTLGEAFKIICDICDNRYPGSIRVINDQKGYDFVSVRIDLDKKKLRVFGVDDFGPKVVLDLDSKVKFEGEDLEVEGYRLTFLKQPETIDIMEHLCPTSP